MASRRFLWWAIPILLLSARGATAFDLRGVDILSFQLGMHLRDVETMLQTQGVGPERWKSRGEPCADNVKAECVAELTAPTRDGWLTFIFTAGGGGVRRIDYRFKAKGAGEVAMIRASVVLRFGDPSDIVGTGWCPRLSLAGTCPTDRPHLRLRSDPGKAPTLTLTDGSDG